MCDTAKHTRVPCCVSAVLTSAMGYILLMSYLYACFYLFYGGYIGPALHLTG